MDHTVLLAITTVTGPVGERLQAHTIELYFWLWLVVWLSGNALASINVVALRQTRLVLRRVTVCGRVNHFGM